MAVGTFQDGLRDAAKSAVCQALGASSDFGNALVYAWQEVTGITASPPDFAGIAKGLLCGSPSPPFPPAPGGYGGANCTCNRYRISYSLQRKGGQAPLTGSEVFFGPIAGINLAPGGAAGNTRIDFFCRGKVGTDPSCLPGFVTRSSGAGTSAGDITGFEITSVQNLDNPGSNCTPTPTPTPTPLPDTGISFPNVNIDFRPSVEVASPVINVTANVVVFQPFVNLNADIVVPVNLDVNLTVGSVNFNVNAEVNLNTGDINFRFGGGGATTGGGGGGYKPPSGCDDVDEPVRNPPPKPPSVPGKPDDPDITEKTILSGVIVTTSSVTLTNRATVINQGENPDIYAPSLGFVSFYLEIGEDKVQAWTADIPVKNRRQFIPCPYEEGAKSVAGTPQPGVIWSLTPVFKKVRTQLPKESNNGA